MENKRKKGIAPPRYDEAFKAGAIRMVTEQGRPSTEVATLRCIATIIKPTEGEIKVAGHDSVFYCIGRNFLVCNKKITTFFLIFLKSGDL